MTELQVAGWRLPVPVAVLEPVESALGAVVLFHHRGGTDNFIRDAGFRLRDAGLVVLVPDMFVGLPPDLTADERKHRLRDDDVVALTVALVAYAREQHGSSAPAALGFCMGARLAFLAAAAATGVSSACCFYGGGLTTAAPAGGTTPVQRVALLREPPVPIQLHRGTRDSVATDAEQQDASAYVEDAGGYLEACVYTGARHAFCNRDDPQRYHPRAAERAWWNALGFLTTTISGFR